MILASYEQSSIVATERGLTISGTRVSIYDILDFLKVNYPPKLIQDKFNLTDSQISAAISYIDLNRTQVEAEYQEVLKTREEIRQYWDDYNQERFARIAMISHQPEKQMLWAKLEEQKTRRISARS